MYLANTPPNKQLQPIDLVAPGFRGLNLVQAGALLSPAYAIMATNAVIDTTGRLAARDGLTNMTTTPIGGSPLVRTLFEYLKSDGSRSFIVAWDGGIGTSLADPSGSDISGAVVDANGAWKFVNFNSKVVGFQAGQAAIVYNGAGNFANVVASSGTAPTGGIGTSAFGRIWQLDSDQQTIKYSGLLNETQWASGGAGQIDMRNIWTQGMDIVTAIIGFNGLLVVFGNNHIVFFGDGVGSALGINPTNLVVTDVVAGTGCLTQHSIQFIGQTDVIFLSAHGVQSLSRVVQERSNPITANLTKYVRTELARQLALETVGNIRATYNPTTGMYILGFPANGTTWVLDQRRRYRDEDGDECAIVTNWIMAPYAMLTSQAGNIYVSVTGGKVAQYLGSTDQGSTFRFVFQGPWLNLGEDYANRLKILKRLGAILFVRNQTNVLFKWSVDFADDFESITRTVSGATPAEWGVAEYGIAEWSGGFALRILKIPARKSGRGQYFRIGIEADVNGQFAIQQAEMFTKIGRVA
jgi:hypothetical protein